MFVCLFVWWVCILLHQVFPDWLTQTIRLYDNHDFIEVSWTVGPIPFQDGLGKEIVSVWSTGLKCWDMSCWGMLMTAIVDLMENQTWYTDANGRDMQQHRFNYRPTWHLIVTDPFVGSYFTRAHMLWDCVCVYHGYFPRFCCSYMIIDTRLDHFANLILEP